MLYECAWVRYLQALGVGDGSGQRYLGSDVHDVAIPRVQHEEVWHEARSAAGELVLSRLTQ